MKSFKQFITENINNKFVVIYAGRFNPFHKNHFSTYQHLVGKFGKENVYIGTSNKTDNDNSPLNFNEKKNIMTSMFKIPSKMIIQITNPYKPMELLNNCPDNTSYIAAVGEKDSKRLNHGKYFKMYKDGIKMGPYKDVGYTYIVPLQTMKFEGELVSGTSIRKIFRNEDQEIKERLFLELYGKMNKSIFTLIDKRI